MVGRSGAACSLIATMRSAGTGHHLPTRRWWGLLASVGFACFLAYAWEFDNTGILYALIAGLVSSVAIVAGNLARRSLRL